MFTDRFRLKSFVFTGTLFSVTSMPRFLISAVLYFCVGYPVVESTLSDVTTSELLR